MSVSVGIRISWVSGIPGAVHLEIKGRERDRDHTKRRFLDEWIAAVNAHGGFGRWRWAVSRKPGDVHDVLAAASDGAVTTGSPPE